MAKRLLLFCLVGGIAGIVIVSASSIVSSRENSKAEPKREQSNRIVVDGSREPHKIPQHVAYSIFFRLISRRQSTEEISRARSYLKLALGLNSCDGKSGRNSRESEEADIDTLLTAADKFNRRVGILDLYAVNIQERYHPNHHPLTPEDQQQLKLLKKKKKAIVDEIVESLSERLSAQGYAALQRHVNQRMKRNIKWTEDQEAQQ